MANGWLSRTRFWRGFPAVSSEPKPRFANSGLGYSLGVWLLMTLYAAPWLLAWNLWDPLDFLPYLECFAVGGAVSLVVWRLSRLLPPAAGHGSLQLGIICWAPCLAIGVGLGANVLFDRSLAVTHATVFLGHQNAHKGPSHVRFASWRKSGTEERLTCMMARSPSLCPDMQPGDPAAVTTHRGALGWEWVEQVARR